MKTLKGIHLYYNLFTIMSIYTLGFVDEEMIQNLMKECFKMKEFNQRGVCLDGGPSPYIVMPFMANGSLQSHLKEYKRTLVIDPNSIDLDDVVRQKSLCL